MSNLIEYNFKSPRAGVMARYNGAMTGGLKLHIIPRKNRFVVEVAYQETDTWYPVLGGSFKDNPAKEIHDVISHLIKELPIGVDDNPTPTSLKDFKKS